MDKAIAVHISFLEQQLSVLRKELTEEGRTRVERERIESEISAAELALVYYRKALQLEQQLTTQL